MCVAACGRGQRERRSDGRRAQTTVHKRRCSKVAQQRNGYEGGHIGRCLTKGGLDWGGAVRGAHIAMGAIPKDTAATELTALDEGQAHAGVAAEVPLRLGPGGYPSQAVTPDLHNGTVLGPVTGVWVRSGDPPALALTPNSEIQSTTRA
ncbi:hypothetical protein NDU88_008715 [Pleurodeles waltl]|uniref:Uncharacterized protein n=1 Tax=Pleurodeles waltl TaxID=8319 RepID=A0AAV7QRG9_PLEWA|nr:hypothetical protein NDU88_008715 [Pleurodeles waltl]